VWKVNAGCLLFIVYNFCADGVNAKKQDRPVTARGVGDAVVVVGCLANGPSIRRYNRADEVTSEGMAEESYIAYPCDVGYYYLTSILLQ